MIHLAHGAAAPGMTTWVLDLPALLLGGVLTALYLSGAARRSALSHARPRSTAAFLTGVVIVLLSHVSPLAVYSRVLFWPHMVQHLLILVVAAPLLAWSSPVATIRHGLPRRARHGLAQLARRSRRARRGVGSPPPLLLATVTHIAVIWLWHTPPIYDAAVEDHGLHLLEHTTFLASAVWFWSEIRSSARRSPRTQGIATLCLGAMIVQGGVLGATITFASRSLYDVYTGFGTMGALEDQQLAGALMWVPPSLLYASAAIRRFIGWFDLVGGGDPPPPPQGSEDPRDRPPDRGVAVAGSPTDPPP